MGTKAPQVEPGSDMPRRVLDAVADAAPTNTKPPGWRPMRRPTLLPANLVGILWWLFHWPSTAVNVACAKARGEFLALVGNLKAAWCTARAHEEDSRAFRREECASVLSHTAHAFALGSNIQAWCSGAGNAEIRSTVADWIKAIDESRESTNFCARDRLIDAAVGSLAAAEKALTAIAAEVRLDKIPMREASRLAELVRMGCEAADLAVEAYVLDTKEARAAARAAVAYVSGHAARVAESAV